MKKKNSAVIDALIKAAKRAFSVFFRTKAVLKLLALAAAFIALGKLIAWLPSIQIRRGAMPERERPAQPELLGEISHNNGLTLVAANGGKQMYVDPAALNISVVDEASGLVWNAFRREAGGTPEEMSLMRLSFLARDNVISNWYSYNYSQKNGGFTIMKIPNGVRLNVQIKDGEPTNINAFMPRRIAIDRYEKTFLRGLDEKVKQGLVTEAEAGRYKSVLGMLFAKNEERGYYYNKLASSPPASAVRQMLNMAQLLEYSVEQLIEDEAPYELPAEDRRPPVGFLIPIDVVLDNGDMVVSISTENIEVQNSFYTLTRLWIMPNFGSVSANEYSSGYIFVPDGSGALISLNSFDPRDSGYERPLNANTIFRDAEIMPQFPEDLKLPVYGMTYGEDGGFMAIIEKGDETAFIGAKAASPKQGSSGDIYNSVYSGFDVTQFKQISIAGAAGYGGTYAAGTGMLEMDYVVRFKLFGKPLSYFEMAAEYRNYLAEKYGLKPDYYASPQIYLDVPGALSIEGRFLGKAIGKTVSMTGYSTLTEILADLRGIPITVSYSGVFNGGIDNKLPNRAALVSENGTPGELKRLLEYAADNGADLYMGTNIARVYRKSGNGYNESRHSARGYDGKQIYFASYDPATKLVRPLSPRYTVLNPIYLPNVLDGFLANTRQYDKIYINDLGRDYYASYQRKAVIPPLAGRTIANEALRRLDEKKTLALNDPGIDKIPYAAWAVNISRESSNHGSFYTSIPFRQLVMNGFIRYTTLDVNNSGETPEYYLLQALELGSVPKFLITEKNADMLKWTVHTEFLSTQYSVHKDNIKKLYAQWAAAYEKIGSSKIIRHETLEDGVYKTTYSGGASVTVNYNHWAARTNEGEIIPPRGYVIKENRL